MKERLASGITRGHSKNLREFTNLSGASHIIWAPVPLSNESPWPAGAAWLGDYNNAASYAYLVEWLQLAATVAGYDQAGGMLLKVNKKTKALYDRVIRMIAAAGLNVPGVDEAVRAACVKKYTHMTAYFDADVINDVERERQRLRARTQQIQEERNRASAAGSGGGDLMTSQRNAQEVTLILFGSYAHDGSEEHTELYHAEMHQDGYTKAERDAIDAERYSASLGDDASGGGGDDMVADGAPLRLDEIAGQAAALVAQIQPKWRVICIEVRKKGQAQERRVDLKRSAFHQSLGPEYNEESMSDVAGFVYGFICMDPSINPGAVTESIIDWNTKRAAYDQLVLGGGGGARTYDRGYGDGPLYSRATDPLWYLHPYQSRGHFGLAVDRQRLARLAGQASGARMGDEWMRAAIHSMIPGDSSADINICNFASLSNALRVIDAFGGDIGLLNPRMLYLNAAGPDTLRNPLGMYDLEIPNGVRAWEYSTESARQVLPPASAGPGMLDAYFPTIDKNYGMAGALRNDDSGDGISDDPLIREQQERELDPKGLFDGDEGRLEVAMARRDQTVDFRRFFAPFDTGGDMHPHYYYAGKVRMSQTIARFVDPNVSMDDYHDIWCAAMRAHERDLRPFFEEAMNVSTPTNEYSMAMLRGIEAMKRKYQTLTTPLYLHDCGKSNEEVLYETGGADAFVAKYGRPYNRTLDQWGERHPEYPGMDPFAHFVIKYVRLLRQVKGVEDPVLVFFCHKVTSTCYNFRPGKLCPVIVVSAPAGEGKTYILKVIASLSVDGTTRGENHLSTHGQTAANDMDVAILTDEGGGFLQHKKTADSKSVEINKAAVGGTGTLVSRRAEYQINANGQKKLTTVETKVMHNKSYLIGTNLRFEDLVEEIAARTWFFDKKSAFLPAASLTWDNIAHMGEGIKTWNKLQQMCRFSIYKAKMTGYIPEFDKLDTLDMVLTSMTHKLHKMGVQQAENNAWNRVHDKIREACIDDMVTYAIAAAIHMPGGVCYQDDWELTLWKRVSPMLYVTKQVMLWNILGLQREWTGDAAVVSDMLQSAMRLANYHYKEGKTPAEQYADDVDRRIQWRRAKKYERNPAYQAGAAPPPPPVQGVAAPPSFNAHRPYEGTPGLQLGYVRITLDGSTFRAISDGMHDDTRLQPRWVEAQMKRLSKSAVFVPKRHQYTVATEEELDAFVRELRRVGQRPDGQEARAAMDWTRDLRNNQPIPMVEIKGRGRGLDAGTMYIATEAVEQLAMQDLISAFMWATASSQFHPQAFLLPTTHPKHHDIMDKLVVSASYRDAWVDHIDRYTAAKYARKWMRKTGAQTMPDIQQMLAQRQIRDNRQVRYGGEGAEAFLVADVRAMKTECGLGRLTEDWVQDSLYVSRKNGLARVNHSFMDDVDRAFLLSAPLMGKTSDSEFEEIKRQVTAARGDRISLITVDLDDKAAYDRHVLCGLPLRDHTGAPVPIQTLHRTCRNFLEYMSGRSRGPAEPPMDMVHVDYPADQIEQRKYGGDAFALIHDDMDDDDDAEFAGMNDPTHIKIQEFNHAENVALGQEMSQLRAMQSSFAKRPRVAEPRGVPARSRERRAQEPADFPPAQERSIGLMRNSSSTGQLTLK